jgi:hypothetical protein
MFWTNPVEPSVFHWSPCLVGKVCTACQLGTILVRRQLKNRETSLTELWSKDFDFKKLHFKIWQWTVLCMICEIRSLGYLECLWKLALSISIYNEFCLGIVITTKFIYYLVFWNCLQKRVSVKIENVILRNLFLIYIYFGIWIQNIFLWSTWNILESIVDGMCLAMSLSILSHSLTQHTNGNRRLAGFECHYHVCRLVSLNRIYR